MCSTGYCADTHEYPQRKGVCSADGRPAEVSETLACACACTGAFTYARRAPGPLHTPDAHATVDSLTLHEASSRTMQCTRGPHACTILLADGRSCACPSRAGCLGPVRSLCSLWRGRCACAYAQHTLYNQRKERQPWH